MEPLAILTADPFDLLFENRNKLYGAYILRKYYPRRLMISITIIISLVIMISFIYLYPHSEYQLQNHPQPPDVFIRQLDLTQEIKPPAPPARPSMKRPPASTALTKPLIVTNQNMKE